MGIVAARPRLVFWPEAALEAWLDVEPEWLSRVAMLLGPRDLLMTGGVKPYIEDTPRGRMLTAAANSTWVVTPGIRLAARYDKAHLVPYGEYLPMRSLLEPIGLSRLVPGDADFLPGPGPRSLFLPAGDGRPPLKMGVQICYEIIFSGHVVDAHDRPDFLFNPSNDAWFGSWGPPQHLAQARTEGRVLFTQDPDFLRLHAARAAHAGIVYAPQGTSMVADAYAGDAVLPFWQCPAARHRATAARAFGNPACP